MLNFALMRHWENWLTVVLMTLIAFYAINSLSKLIATPKSEGN